MSIDYIVGDIHVKKQRILLLSIDTSIDENKICGAMVSDKCPPICSICCNHNPILSLFMTNHWVCSKSNMKSGKCGAGTALIPFRSISAHPPDFSRVTRVPVARSLFCRSLCVLLAIALSVLLRFTASDFEFLVFNITFSNISDISW